MATTPQDGNNPSSGVLPPLWVGAEAADRLYDLRLIPRGVGAELGVDLHTRLLYRPPVRLVPRKRLLVDLFGHLVLLLPLVHPGWLLRHRPLCPRTHTHTLIPSATTRVRVHPGLLED
eukprot:9492022-Pyramimonas_sp.AAC.1